MSTISALLFLFLFVVVFLYFRENLARKKSQSQLAELAYRFHNEEIKVKELEDLFNKMRTDSVLLPSVVRWIDHIREQYDRSLINNISYSAGASRSRKVADQVRAARALVRVTKKEIDLLQNRVDLYEALAPWLIEYVDYTVDEIIGGIQEEENFRRQYESSGDPVRLFLVADEWKRLAEADRNQLALDRYWNASRRLGAWTVGIQYERFIGYLYEKNGFEVEYHGAIKGKQDSGIDLICRKNGLTQIVQCKRLSVEKGIPVREKVIAQLYGAALFYAIKNELGFENVIPVLVTTYKVSDEAREFSNGLGVVLKESIAFDKYPSIKCNISKTTGEKIYHLPFDQQYDRTKIGHIAGELYAFTVKEAESLGFRRAFKWYGVG